MRILTVVGGGLAGVAAVFALAAGPASASPAGSLPTVPAGGECTAAQAAAHAQGRRGGDLEECRAGVDAHGRPCFLWKYAGPLAGLWTGGPAHCRSCSSPSASPSPVVSASPPASPTPSPAASPTSASPVPVDSSGYAHAGYGGPTATSSATAHGPTGRPRLPVTGSASAAIAGVGVLLMLGGVGLLRMSRRRAG